MKIGIDIDNTITDNTHILKKCINDFNSSRVEYDKLSYEEHVDFLNKYGEEIFKNNIIKPGVKEAFKYMNDNNFEIILITKRGNPKPSFDYQKVTYNYFKDNEIVFNKIIFDSVNKGLDCKREGIDFMLDDLVSNLEDCKEYGIKGIYIGDKDTSFLSVRDWYEFLKYIKERVE